MNCHSCIHARPAVNKDLVGCAYWTAIYQGNMMAMRSALIHINRKENYKINMDSEILEKEAIDFLIDVLIEDYAPKPLYEGWADLNRSCYQNKNHSEMTDSCVVLEPKGCCDFYTARIEATAGIREDQRLRVNH
jgi:hypothetical protein